ncbi:MAG TPA: type II toxin-antitoxin system RelE/ParE family toxin [Flavobacteriaceae bacterium]|nr:type II toxin-antitoxin system RelE/ParE family toxin [Flavobacteriaceae bacterium]
MQNGYKIRWTSNALRELQQTFEYLEREFSEKELNKLAIEIEHTMKLISQNPYLFQKSEFKNIYRAIIFRFNILYYRINNDEVEILSFFSNRQNPKNRKTE